MRNLLILSGLMFGLVLTTTSCGEKDSAQATPAPTTVQLPLTIDFATVAAAGTTGFTAGGIDFAGAGVPQATLVNGMLPCVSSTNATIRQASSPAVGTNTIVLAYADFNCLIADVSKLPAMQKITVRLFDNGSPSTQISLCSGSQSISSFRNTSGNNPTAVYTLSVGGKTGSKFYIYSPEANIRSITFE